MEVFKLIAKGLFNNRIAEALVINKLHLVDRTQAAAYAWQEGIVHREQVRRGNH